MPFNLKVILTFSVHKQHIVNTVQFKILNRKCSFSNYIQLHPIESNWIELNPIKSKKSIRYLKYAFGQKKISIHSRLLGSDAVTWRFCRQCGLNVHCEGGLRNNLSKTLLDNTLFIWKKQEIELRDCEISCRV